MYSRWQLAKKYVRYYFTASNGKGHGVHSPFVFDLIIKVLDDTRRYEAYDHVEALRHQLRNNTAVLEVEDFGAGSVTAKTNRRSIASIARHAAKPRKYGQLLFRIVQYYQPSTVLELGTSLGVSAAYMAMGNTQAVMITAEGSEAIAGQARTNLRQLGVNNVQVVRGNFDDTLQDMLAALKQVDLAFVDGNHRLEPTIRYFEQLLPFTHDHSIVIFDDIHWSEDMEQAWEAIKSHEAVTLTVDLFFIGLAFFRKDFKVKQHFTVRF